MWAMKFCCCRTINWCIFRCYIAVRYLYVRIHTKMLHDFACNLSLPSYEVLTRIRRWHDQLVFLSVSKLGMNMLIYYAGGHSWFSRVWRAWFEVHHFVYKLIKLHCVVLICISSSESSVAGSSYFMLHPRYLKMVVFSTGVLFMLTMYYRFY